MSRLGRARDWLYGDRVGLALFLGVVCFGALSWRAGLFITDNETLARTLEALSEGRFWVERAEGEYLQSPGADVRDGRVYGRNYGQLVVSLPALVVLRAVEFVANLRVALVAGWHLTALALLSVVGAILDRRRPIVVGGSLAVLLSFVLNLSLATRLPEPDTALLALQVTTLIATGLIAVLLYRALALDTSQRLAAAAGAASVVVLPVGFWATIPKRHVFSVLACVAVLFLFARSRRAERRPLPGVGRVPVFRASAYAVVGFLTWVHAAEGLFVFLALAAVDLPTAENDRRGLAFVGAVFALSMLPVLVTNLLVAGSPVEPPRTVGGGSVTGAAGSGDGGSAGGGGSSGPLDAVGDLVVVGGLVWLLSQVVALVVDSLAVFGEPDRLYHTFVRGEGADLTGSTDNRGDLTFVATNLSVLEVAPVLGATVVVAGAWLARLLRQPRDTLARVDPAVGLAGTLAVAYLLIYLSRLPLFAQITQRYLLPIYPLALYALVRSTLARRLVNRAPRALAWSYAAGLLVGGQVVLAFVLVQEQTIAEAAQFNARLALLVAGIVVGATGVSALADRFETAAAVTVGLAAAAGTVFLLLSGLYYFAGTGEALLPVVQAISDQL
jgi:uncharacterized membrane protein YgcG